MKNLARIAALLLLLVCFSRDGWAETSDGIPLLQARINPADLASLQRGAKLYINYCSGCHSLNFMRYNRLAQGIGIVDKNGQVDAALVKENLIFTGAKISDTLQIAMRKDNAKTWFGVAPPDLSDIARARGVDWLYTYLKNFYQDNSRPLGVNNLLFNETAMPNVLVSLQGEQIPLHHPKEVIIEGQPTTVQVIDRLVVNEPGSMSPQQFDIAVNDLVNFLAFVSDPGKREREQLGFWVIGFLLIFAVLTYLLKKEYWKNVK